MNRDPKISDVLPGGMLDPKATAMAEMLYPATTKAADSDAELANGVDLPLRAPTLLFAFVRLAT